MKHTKTFKVRVRDKYAPLLRQMARSVNYVWNYLNELSQRAIRERGVFLSAFDLQKYTNGCARELSLHSHSVQEIGKEYATRRKQFKKARLNWRKSGGARRSLGWIPFKAGAASWKHEQVYHNGHFFKVWDSYGLGQYRFRSGSFNEDARGRWYFNVVVEVDARLSAGQDALGIDLGLKDVAICSNGTRLENTRFYRDLEPALAVAQRAGKKDHVRAIHAKIANRRKDAAHKFSRALVDRCNLIVVGDVSPTKLAKTPMAKSVLDAGWGQLKTMLGYKCAHAGIVFKEVSEVYTTRTCSSCGSLSGPQGVSGLRIRDWACCECGVAHDRDVNAARNILAAGHGRPAVGISGLYAGEDVIELQFHPISLLFPLIIGEEFSSLRNDIDVNGQHEPIVLHEGMILDGRNRYRACCDLELTPITKEYEGDDPLAWVLSHNLFRRQLTVAQRALIAAELSTLQNDKADSGGGEGKPEQIAIDKAAKQLGISARTVSSACKVVRDGTPALLEAVKNGQIRISAAEQVSKLDEENRRTYVSKALGLAALRKRKSRGRNGPSEDYPARYGSLLSQFSRQAD